MLGVTRICACGYRRSNRPENILIAAILLQNVCLADGFWAGVHLAITQTIFCLKELPHLISIFYKYQGIAMR